MNCWTKPVTTSKGSWVLLNKYNVKPFKRVSLLQSTMAFSQGYWQVNDFSIQVLVLASIRWKYFKRSHLDNASSDMLYNCILIDYEEWFRDALLYLWPLACTYAMEYYSSYLPVVMLCRIRVIDEGWYPPEMAHFVDNISHEVQTFLSFESSCWSNCYWGFKKSSRGGVCRCTCRGTSRSLR